ncbi:O-antigen ligase family protein [Shewanella sp. 1CM18E]|uniref:O-antigen ligase family protein n=1 Tax=Shewanella sp. 1CM18E TaxID=2929169 RepID=UPI0020BDBB73|nr:O-antigen ligase family protein [Shewanella sp. 1CM18E]MCK8043304.1 O-antigen ligase family protein [Shewanella sp. 1CM18E]
MLTKIAFTACLIELFIGGSGQVFTIFGIPLRQIFFVFLLLSFFLDLILSNDSVRFSKHHFVVFLMIFGVFLFAFIGIMKGHDHNIIFNDVSPMLYFLMFFPFYFYMNKWDISFTYIYRILYVSSFIVSTFVIVSYFVIKTFFDGQGYSYGILLESWTGREILWFRPGGFVFYPSLFYVLVTSVIIFGRVYDKSKVNFFELLTLGLGILAIFLSMTKGLILCLAIGFVLVLASNKLSLKKFLLIAVALGLSFFISLSYLDFSRLTNLENDRGMENRYQVIDESLEVLEHSYLIGNGFGTELPTKKQHQENSYMDILVEQGIFGLCLYLYLFYLCLVDFKFLTHFKIAMIASVLMSLTNPYVNNPIGIGFILILLTLNLRRRKSFSLSEENNA